MICNGSRRRTPRRAGAALLLLLCPLLGFAQVRVEDAWVRGSVPGQRSTGAFMRLLPSSDAALVGATSPAAGHLEIHATTMDGGIMRMRSLSRVPLKANQPLELKPGGHHLMLMGLKAPASEGERIPLVLVFEDASGKRSSVEVTATVRPLGSDARTKHAH